MNSTHQQRQVPHVLFTSTDRGWHQLEAEFVCLPPGRAESAGRAEHLLGMHFGPPVKADCTLGGHHSRYVQRHGDIGVVPAGVSGAWEDDAALQLLRITLRPLLLMEVAEQLGRSATNLELIPHFQLRDTRLEAIALAIKADIEDDTPSDPLYSDLLANALAVRLIELATDRDLRVDVSRAPKFSQRQLKHLTDFIESHLGQKLSLAELAKVVGVSATHFKTMFRNSTGTPVHQYVVGRRLEYARALLATTTMPASQIALVAGFAHQSHLASTMRRLLGHTPSDIDRPSQ